MAEVIYMPKLSDTMTEGVVADWNKKVGDAVSEGELLAEIETDKATMEFESFYDGFLLHIGVGKGEAAPVNTLLAIIGKKGEDVKKIIAESSVAPPIEAPKAEEKKEVVAAPIVEAVKEVAVVAAPVSVSPPPVSADGNGRVFASPLAKRMASDKGIDLSNVIGTGDAGRIVKRDIEHYVPYVPALGGGKKAHVGVETYTEEPISQMRKTIAKRLAESKFTAPHFYLTLAIDMDRAIDLRTSIKNVGGPKISFNDMVIKASALALREHPNVNSSWLGDVIRRNQHIHIGVAVAVDEGLLVPVVRFADGKGMDEIGAEVRVLADKAKNKKLQPSEWEGNTFTISNLGMFGIEEFTAIVNPPDSCILAIGGINQVPVVKEGKVVPGNVMKVTLSCDHRVVDGATGAAFLNTFKKYLENPVAMLL
ncbi:MAG: pyruvate dehydrogenase E2 component (dihydrolipoamide acetyltransferase) [Crocinitomicaceae bacterium]|jgi:pyruvate dehydrogenase E2 component (dihydrolipoamide acetyltransferase)